MLSKKAVTAEQALYDETPTAHQFRHLVEAAIRLHRKHREQHLDRHIPGMAMAHVLRELCTVRVDVGRGVGKTTAMRHLAKAGDVVVLHSHKMRQVFGVSEATVLCGNRLDDWMEGWRNLDLGHGEGIVWVDEGELLLRAGPADWFYDRLAYLTCRRPGKLPTVVMLGGGAPNPEPPDFAVRGRGPGDLDTTLRLAMRCSRDVRSEVLVTYRGLERVVDSVQAMHFLHAMVIGHLAAMANEVTPGDIPEPIRFPWLVTIDPQRRCVRVDGC